jgi:molybdopterin-guanine dinucleotide biosynthesis protein A
MTIAMHDITGLVLAGGRGARMGGLDKGLQNFNGTPLALHAVQRLRAQVGTVMLNANRNLAIYESFGVPVWPDADSSSYAGPLAGFVTGLEHCETPCLLTMPCDTPRVPRDLADRLGSAMAEADAEIAMVSAPEADDDGAIVLRPQPVFCLLRASLRDSLQRFIGQGGRKIDLWTAQHRLVHVPFDGPDDAPDAFANANTLAELQALEARPAPSP